MCSICAEEVSPSDPAATTIACGHVFHVPCILQWFRFEHTTCPNCRSEETEAEWTRPTALQRIGAMRRRYRSLPKHMQKKLRDLDNIKTCISAATRARRQLRSEHAALFRNDRNLYTKIMNFKSRRHRLTQQLSTNIVCPHVPLLQRVETESEVSDSLDSDDDDAASVVV